MHYNYLDGSNKLDFVHDDVDASSYNKDIDSQNVGNYSYDAVGNLVSDRSNGIDDIKWTYRNKISDIHKLNSDGSSVNIHYTYDVSGNRISKSVNGAEIWYVRDPVVFNGNSYRFGFNRQEQSGEIHSNTYTAPFWEYDSRVARRWSLDPRPTIGVSDYSVLGNCPL